MAVRATDGHTRSVETKIRSRTDALLRGLLYTPSGKRMHPTYSCKKYYGKQTGRPITHELPAPAGGVRLETFVPWTLVKRGCRKQVIAPFDAPQAFLSEATRGRAARAATRDTALMRALASRTTGNACWTSTGRCRWPRSPRPRAWT